VDNYNYGLHIFSLRRYTSKYLVVKLALTNLLASATSAYSMGLTSMMRDLHCTKFQTSIGLSVFALGFGSVPMVTASFTEEFGRHPLYIGSGIGFILMYAMVALYVRVGCLLHTFTSLMISFVKRSNNIHTVILARFLQGSFGSTGAIMVGGTIADLWSPKECDLYFFFRPPS
jgi:MFS family permease